MSCITLVGMSKALHVKKGVLLVNLGTPSEPTPKAVRQFLREFLSDSRVVELPRILWLPILYGIILPFRSSRSARNYQKIWTDQGSPLMDFSQRLVDKIRDHAADQFVVGLAMRYGTPSIQSVLEQFQAQSVDEVTIVPMYPQYSATTSASIFDEVTRVLSHWRWVPSIRFVSHYADHPRYIDAVSSAIAQYVEQNGLPDQLLFSYHGIPERCFKAGDPYWCYCHKTTRLITEKLGLAKDRWQMVFQSRFGREKWLEPYCDKTLEQLPAQGVKSVAVVCPGFSVDCLETLEEIAIANRSLFLAAGGTSFDYIPALNDGDAHAALFLSLVNGNGSANKAILPNSGSSDESSR